MNEYKALTIIWIAVLLAVVGIAWAIAWGTTIVDREAVAAGLVQVQTPSIMQNNWVKP
jgi:hypothetical protein